MLSTKWCLLICLYRTFQNASKRVLFLVCAVTEHQISHNSGHFAYAAGLDHILMKSSVQPERKHWGNSVNEKLTVRGRKLWVDPDLLTHRGSEKINSVSTCLLSPFCFAPVLRDIVKGGVNDKHNRPTLLIWEHLRRFLICHLFHTRWHYINCIFKSHKGVDPNGMN